MEIQGTAAKAQEGVRRSYLRKKNLSLPYSCLLLLLLLKETDFSLLGLEQLLQRFSLLLLDFSQRFHLKVVRETNNEITHVIMV